MTTPNPADPLRNPKDPLHAAGPEADRELFRQYAQLAEGFPFEAVLGAACNLLVNGIRQAHASRTNAERHFDELIGRTKSVLMSHYDANGRRRNVFPFDQTIEVPLVTNKNRF